MSADLLARLIEAGTPAALVAEVAMLAARADAAGEQIEGRRAKDRERQTRRRHAMSRDITLDSVTTRDVTADPSPTPSPSSSPDPSNNPTPAPTREVTPARTRKAAAWPCPDGVDPEHWADLIANRKSKRLANTPTALAGILRDIAKHADDEWPPGRIVQHAAERGWGAIFDPRPNTGNRHGQQSDHARSYQRGGWNPRPGMEGAEPAFLPD
ncbi:hypothetical protein [Sphingomonas sp. DC2300-3]|uniref:hypothetical protein n=1 Tax=unclassified Sphingomonas TaxID=196159 RepID=UPI003CEA8EA1